MGESAYDPQRYWSSLLDDRFDLTGVGHPDLPLAWNLAMYEAMRRSVDRAVASAGVEVAGRCVLDVGCGIGFWVDDWLRRGAREVSGLDLTEVSVNELRRRYPQGAFHVGDISAQELAVGDARFDVVSAMSVLLHIPDDARFEQAVANLARLVAPGGALVVMDPLVVHRWWGSALAGNSRLRTRDQWDAALRRNGLAIAEIEPVTWLLSDPVDTRSRVTFGAARFAWRAAVKLFHGHERTTKAALPLIAAADRALTALGGPGPSTKCFVARPL